MAPIQTEAPKPELCRTLALWKVGTVQTGPLSMRTQPPAGQEASLRPPWRSLGRPDPRGYPVLPPLTTSPRGPSATKKLSWWASGWHLAVTLG